MKVLKFGGSSVGSPQKIREVKQIIESQPEPDKVVVVSAFQGVTDVLTHVTQLAAKGDLSYTDELQQLKKRHLDAVAELVVPKEQYRVASNVQLMLNDLETFLHGIYLIKDYVPKSLDYILSFGERLSAYIISQSIANADYIDISPLLKTDSTFGNARVIFEEASPLVIERFKNLDKLPIVPGFVGSTKNNIMTTLGRGGSDYTAAVLAYILDAEMLEIWTDVDGFMTADPRKVSKTYSVETLSYAEAMELSHFGAKVLYTPTVQPAYMKNIPIRIKNTMNPSAVGTLISNNSEKDTKRSIKGIASIDEVSLLTLHGTGLVGVAGISMRLFKALASEKVNVILISQASSETSISFAVSPEEAKKAKLAISKEFKVEIEHYQSIRIEDEDGLSVIAIVGENMKKTPGIAAKLFDALGRNGINIAAIAQGSSELNISVVISRNQLRKALNVVHEGFFLSNYVRLNLFLLGIGTVGGDLLEQIKAQQERLLSSHRLNIKLAGIANSKKMLFDETGIDIANYKELLHTKGEKMELNGFAEKMEAMNLRNSVFIDCTANKDVADLYKDILNHYISVVTANKIACSSEYAKYRELKDISLNRRVKFLYETNVGAGLPVLRTISDLIKSGDTILKIQAVLSGTLTFIFNTISAEISLSQAIRLAKEKGYSEPDPRLDLCGLDVLRKILILSREAGHAFEKEDIKIKQFLPEACINAATMEEFWAEVEKIDVDFENDRKRLEAEGKKWRYVASFENQSADIQLIEVDSQHPFYNMKGSDNIVLLHTERYSELPMMIKGPGAGAAVTATGVFADIISVVNI